MVYWPVLKEDKYSSLNWTNHQKNPKKTNKKPNPETSNQNKKPKPTQTKQNNNKKQETKFQPTNRNTQRNVKHISP